MPRQEDKIFKEGLHEFLDGPNYKARGRPTKYDPTFHPKWGRKLAMLGLTNPELAEFFEVATSTFISWMSEHEEFGEAVRGGKLPADADVAIGLYQSAVGAKWEEEAAYRIGDEIKIVKLQRAAPPNATAAIMWLKNRQKHLWRDNQGLQQVDKNGDPIDALRVEVVLKG